MNDSELEGLLDKRRAQGPASELRSRVLSGVQCKLKAQERVSFWQFVGGLAAVLLLGTNLSMSAANRIEAHFGSASSVNLNAFEAQDVPTPLNFQVTSGNLLFGKSK